MRHCLIKPVLLRRAEGGGRGVRQGIGRTTEEKMRRNEEMKRKLRKLFNYLPNFGITDCRYRINYYSFGVTRNENASIELQNPYCLIVYSIFFYFLMKSNAMTRRENGTKRKWKDTCSKVRIQNNLLSFDCWIPSLHSSHFCNGNDCEIEKTQSKKYKRNVIRNNFVPAIYIYLS